jgi:hypothetical protein
VPLAELRACVRLANEARFKRGDERYATLRKAFNARSEVSRATITQSLVSHQNPFEPTLGFVETTDMDYGPAFVGQLLKGDEETMQRGLTVLQQVLAATYRVGNSLNTQLWLSSQASETGRYDPQTPLPPRLIQCKKMIDQMKEPGFDPYGQYVAVDVVGTTLVPRFSPHVSDSALVN